MRTVILILYRIKFIFPDQKDWLYHCITLFIETAKMNKDVIMKSMAF